jgi:hypothetical protein
MICLFPFAFTARKWLRISVHVVNMGVSTASACERDDPAIEKQHDYGQYLSLQQMCWYHRSRYIDISRMSLRCRDSRAVSQWHSWCCQLPWPISGPVVHWGTVFSRHTCSNTIGLDISPESSFPWDAMNSCCVSHARREKGLLLHQHKCIYALVSIRSAERTNLLGALSTAAVNGTVSARLLEFFCLLFLPILWLPASAKTSCNLRLYLI